MTSFTSTTIAALVLAGTTSLANAQEFNFEIDALNLTPSISNGFSGDNDDLGAETFVRAKAGYTFANGAGGWLPVPQVLRGLAGFGWFARGV